MLRQTYKHRRLPADLNRVIFERRLRSETVNDLSWSSGEHHFKVIGSGIHDNGYALILKAADVGKGPARGTVTEKFYISECPCTASSPGIIAFALRRFDFHPKLKAVQEPIYISAALATSESNSLMSSFEYIAAL